VEQIIVNNICTALKLKENLDRNWVVKVEKLAVQVTVFARRREKKEEQGQQRTRTP